MSGFLHQNSSSIKLDNSTTGELENRKSQQKGRGDISHKEKKEKRKIEFILFSRARPLFFKISATVTTVAIAVTIT